MRIGKIEKYDGYVTITWPWWFPSHVISVEVAKAATEDPELIYTMIGERKVKIEDRAYNLLRRLNEARAQI